MIDRINRSRIAFAASMFVTLLVFASCTDDLRGSQSDPKPSTTPNPNGYLVVTHNVENLFDADGIAVYDDYKPTSADGSAQYTNVQILNKIRNIVRLMQQYGDGNGPDVIMAVEIESDHTPGASQRACCAWTW